MNRIAFLRTRLQRRFGDVYSQHAMAGRIGVSRGMLGRYEAGSAVPNVLIALRIAHELGVTVEQLGFQEVVPPPAGEPAPH